MLLLAAWILSLFSTSSGFTYTYLSSNLCTGSLVKGETTATTKECFSLYRSSISEVTSTATVDDVKVLCVLDKERNPAIDISVAATSPDSPQEYEVNVRSRLYTFPLYCGKIVTEKPTQVPSKQNLRMEMRCEGNILKANMELIISVRVKGQMTGSVFSYRVPSCNHAIMYNSNECQKERKDEILFSLHQKNNSVVVIVDIKTAYQTINSKLYATIKQRKDGFLDDWKPLIEEPSVLYWPEEETLFGDLTPGEIYQISVWRPNEIIRYAKEITIKSSEISQEFFEEQKQAKLEKEITAIKY